MRWHPAVVAGILLLGAPAVMAQSEPSVTWNADDLNLPLRDGTAIDFAFPYDVHMVGGADPEGDAALSIRICSNHRCTEQALAVTEGTSFMRFGLDPTQYHRGNNIYTLSLTLTDNGLVSADTLTIRARVTP